MKKAKIAIYTTPTCAFCHALMESLEDDGIAFDEIDISNPAERAKLEEKIGHEASVVPITIIGDEVIEGFKRATIKRALKKLKA